MGGVPLRKGNPREPPGRFCHLRSATQKRSSGDHAGALNLDFWALEPREIG